MLLDNIQIINIYNLIYVYIIKNIIFGFRFGYFHFFFVNICNTCLVILDIKNIRGFGYENVPGQKLYRPIHKPKIRCVNETHEILSGGEERNSANVKSKWV